MYAHPKNMSIVLLNCWKSCAAFSYLDIMIKPEYSHAQAQVHVCVWISQPRNSQTDLLHARGAQGYFSSTSWIEHTWRLGRTLNASCTKAKNNWHAERRRTISACIKCCELYARFHGVEFPLKSTLGVCTPSAWRPQVRACLRRAPHSDRSSNDLVRLIWHGPLNHDEVFKSLWTVDTYIYIYHGMSQNYLCSICWIMNEPTQST